MAHEYSQYEKEVFTKLLNNSEIENKYINILTSEAFHEDNINPTVNNILKDYQEKYYKSILMCRKISPSIINAFRNVCDQKQIHFIMIDISKQNVLQKNQMIPILYLSEQENDIIHSLYEACAISGEKKEMEKIDFESIKSNPMYQIDNIDLRLYNKIKENMNQLNSSIKFTLFPIKKANGSISMAFFLKTFPQKKMERSKVIQKGPYKIPSILASLIGASLIPVSEKEIEEEKKTKLEYRKTKEALLTMDENFYIMQGILLSNGQIQLNWDSIESINQNEIETYQYNEICNRYNGMNKIAIPLTKDDLININGNKIVSKNDIAFTKNTNIKYRNPEIAVRAVNAERLIDVLNRKREELLLASDDFNLNNLTMLHNYISGRISEFINREDLEYLKYDESIKRINSDIQRDVLNKASKYKLEILEKPPIEQQKEHIQQNKELDIEIS